MQSAFAAKMILPFSSTCTIGGEGNPFYLWKASKIKQVIAGSLVVIFQKTERVLHGQRGGHYAFR